jgi:hypothetical protein
MARVRIAVCVAVLVVAAGIGSAPCFAAGSIRAAYFYDYMTPGHVDSLADVGFNRALVRMIADSLDTQSRGITEFIARGQRRGVSIVPDFLLQAKGRLNALPTKRRYVWGVGHREANVACPLDTSYWVSAFLDRTDEVLEALPGVQAIAIDLELYEAGRGHYDAGACRCSACLSEYTGLPEGQVGAAQAWKLSGMLSSQEARLGAWLTQLMTRFAARHPGVEVGVLDLDFDSFVHRALARALDRARIPTVDYTERTYAPNTGTIAGARARLDALGFQEAKVVGGLWLKRWTPGQLRSGVRTVAQSADGYFVFTSYSLWMHQSLLAGPYTLQGAPAAYWRALKEANRR